MVVQAVSARRRLCGPACDMGIIRYGWSGLRHLSRIVLVAGACGRESRA
jgi:hypothetical protein